MSVTFTKMIDMQFAIILTVGPYLCQIWENLRTMQQNFPVPGNRGGSYLTAWSLGVFEINLIYVSGYICNELHLCASVAAVRAVLLHV